MQSDTIITDTSITEMKEIIHQAIETNILIHGKDLETLFNNILVFSYRLRTTILPKFEYYYAEKKLKLNDQIQYAMKDIPRLDLPCSRKQIFQWFIEAGGGIFINNTVTEPTKYKEDFIIAKMNRNFYFCLVNPK